MKPDLAKVKAAVARYGKSGYVDKELKTKVPVDVARRKTMRGSLDRCGSFNPSKFKMCD